MPHTMPSDFSRITETVSLCRRVANTIRKCYNCNAGHISAGAVVLKCGLRERRLEDLNKLTPSMADVDFSKLHLCCAYMITYAACHSEITYMAMSILLYSRSDSQMVLGRSELTLTSVGGGPGNDLLGAMYALCEKRAFLMKLDLYIVDLQHTWQVFFSTLMSEVKANGVCNKLCKFINSIELSHRFLQGDVTSNEVNEEMREVLGKSDLVLMVKTLCMMTFEEKVRIVKETLDKMKRNSILFIVDAEWPSLVALHAGAHCDVILDVREIIACTKPSTVYSCQNISTIVADAVALKKK